MTQIFHENPPLSLYIHLPWCIKKCPYCDFNSHEILTSAFREELYVNALIDDLNLELDRIRDRRIISIFIGGGTPSLFSPESLDRLLNSARTQLNLGSDIEVTIEANPGAIEAEKFREYRALGINRLSLGIQSFDNQSLTSLGRIHNSSEAKRAIEFGKEAGFKNFNLDLMFGLPNQSIDDALSDLKQAVDQSPTHVSWYQLTIEPGTPFARRDIKLPNNNMCAQFYEETQEIMGGKKMPAYEISNHSRLGSECIHNLNYWEGGDYFGIGPGAHGRFTINETFFSTYQTYDPNTWLKMVEAKGHGTAKCKNMGRKERSEELLMVGLRTRKGINFAKFIPKRIGE